MRIIYVANHGSKGNDEEGAIHHALTELGHEVLRLRESRGRRALRLQGDMLLFHKWHDIGRLKVFGERGLIRVFWWFDLVDFPEDPTIAGRCQARRIWMNSILPYIELGFCTDGDWVARDRSGKLVHLVQGADSRYMGLTLVDRPKEPSRPILFTGIRHGGERRQSFVDDMIATYGDRFNHVSRGVHGQELAELIARSLIVVAPDGPVTDRYWSNRVFLTLGYRGFLLHPWSEGLSQHYRDGSEIVYYRSRDELHQAIRYYLDRPEECRAIARRGFARTVRDHTYQHRCAELMRIVQERFPERCPSKTS